MTPTNTSFSYQPIRPETPSITGDERHAGRHEDEEVVDMMRDNMRSQADEMSVVYILCSGF